MLRISECPQVGGRGVFTTTSYKNGELVLKLSGEEVNQPTRESIEIGLHRHIIDNYGSYINHSFEPTTRVDTTLCGMVAVRDLGPNEQVTFNYNESESCMTCPFESMGITVSGKVSKSK